MSDPLRFFVSPATLHDDQILIDGEPHHHLRNVLRIKPGAKLLLLDGLGQCCEARLEQVHAESSLAKVLRRWQESETALPITLLQALPKKDKFDLVLQKGTELGITCFQPVETEHAIPTLAEGRKDKREQRWQRIIKEAARQCRRSLLPELKPLKPLQEVLAESSEELKLVLWEAGSIPLVEVLPQQSPAGVRLLVGPEGGFSQTEMKNILAAGFQAVHLGPRILRTETAGLAASPILQYLYGDWRCAPPGGNSKQHEE